MTPYGEFLKNTNYIQSVKINGLVKKSKSAVKVTPTGLKNPIPWRDCISG
jgi:hypothetical protein